MTTPESESPPTTATQRITVKVVIRVGDKVQFEESKRWWKVRAVSDDGNFAILTSPFNFQKTVHYTIIDNEPITEHIVHIRAKDFTIRHPLRDRIGHNLEECTVHQWLSSLDEPPREPGTYLVAPTSTGWAWIPQPTQGES